ncbi:MAG: phage prohead protein [Candidatus Amulumruptor caecigallinarius]|nr:phage prohead protein [Candidatus Amulumruptor caecigallinarius]MCM1397456.1 phage prohead protein [Candidatus Amulumruptor caecigallinarius]MCM1454337.1 phage prohead protein [bacterium]
MDKTMKNLMVQTKANDVDEKGRVTVAVNRTGIEDSQGDISMPGSFDATLTTDISRMKWLKDHDVTQLLGVPLEGREKDGDIIMVGQLNMEKQLCRDVYTDYKLMAEYGRTLEHSVGVIAVTRDKVDKRKVHQWKMFEYSTLSFLGANPCTYLVDIKTATPARVRDAVEFLQKALEQPEYSDYRLKDMDRHLSLLLKSLNGARIVTCPHCGHVFDYDEMEEHTFETEVLDCASEYARAIVSGTVYEYMQQQKPEIQTEVGNVLAAIKAAGIPLTAKSITSIMNWVWCPHCWSRVYSAVSCERSVVKAGSKEDEEEKNPSSDSDEDADTDESEDKDPVKEDDRKGKSFAGFLSGLAKKL